MPATVQPRMVASQFHLVDSHVAAAPPATWQANETEGGRADNIEAVAGLLR